VKKTCNFTYTCPFL